LSRQYICEKTGDSGCPRSEMPACRPFEFAYKDCGRSRTGLFILIKRQDERKREEVWFCPYLNFIARIARKNMKNFAAVM